MAFLWVFAPYAGRNPAKVGEAVWFSIGQSGEVGGVDDTTVFAVGFGMIERGVGLIKKIGEFDCRIYSGEADTQADRDTVGILFADVLIEVVHPGLRFFGGKEEQPDKFIAAPAAEEALIPDVSLDVVGGQL